MPHDKWRDLKPAPSSEEPDLEDSENDDRSPGEQISVGPISFGHLGEVLSVETHDERGQQHDRSDRTCEPPGCEIFLFR